MKFGLYIFILENSIFRKSFIQSPFLEIGWGNGYVLLPPTHPFYGKDYDNIPVYVHGGLTFGQKFSDDDRFLEWIDDKDFGGDINRKNYKDFSQYWMIGFDTAHSGDNLTMWSKEDVMYETEKLLDQCLDDSIEGIKKYKTKFLRKSKLKQINNLYDLEKRSSHNLTDRIGDFDSSCASSSLAGSTICD